jgi:hypothetical protein
MFFPLRNKENGSRSHCPLFSTHFLLPPAPQIQKQLPMLVPMRRHPIKRLKMPIHPQRPNRPLSTAQLQVP